MNLNFKYNIGWEFISNYAQNRFVKTSYIYLILVPLIAKSLSNLENPLRIILSGIEYKFDLTLPFSWVLFYFAAFCFTIGYIIYSVFAPPIVKENKDLSSFNNAKKNFNHLVGYLANLGIHNEYVEGLGLEIMKAKSVSGVNYSKSQLSNKKSPKDLEKIMQKMEIYNCLYSNIRDYNKENKTISEYQNESGYISLSFWAIHTYANRIFSANWKIASLIFFALGTIMISIIFLQNLIYVIKILL